MFCIYLSQRILLVCLFDPLVKCVNLYVFVNFLVFQISSFIPLWPEKVLSMHFLCLRSVLWPPIWSVLEALCVPGRDVCSADWGGVFYIHLLGPVMGDVVRILCFLISLSCLDVLTCY